MAQVLVRNLPEEVTQALRDLAKRNAVALEEQLRRILQRAAAESTQFPLPIPIKIRMPKGLTASELLVRDRR